MYYIRENYLFYQTLKKKILIVLEKRLFYLYQNALKTIRLYLFVIQIIILFVIQIIILFIIQKEKGQGKDKKDKERTERTERTRKGQKGQEKDQKGQEKDNKGHPLEIFWSF